MPSEWNQSNVDHRDFQHATLPEDFEKAPAKKWGKNHNKPSPNNKKGCEANDGGKHIYEKVEVLAKGLNLSTWRRTEDYSYFAEMCIGCGKRSSKWMFHYDGPVYTTIDERDMKNGRKY